MEIKMLSLILPSFFIFFIFSFFLSYIIHIDIFLSKISQQPFELGFLNLVQSLILMSCIV